MKATGGASRPRIAPEYVARFKRQSLIDALAELCMENGYRVTTVTHIVARAKTSLDTLYLHFAGKDGLFDALIEASAGDLFAHIESACAEAGDPADARLTAGLDALLSWIDGNRPAAHCLLVESLSASDKSLTFYFTQLSRADELLAGLVPDTVVRTIITIESLVGGVAVILRDRLLSAQPEEVALLLPDLDQFLRQLILSSTPFEPAVVTAEAAQ